MRWWEQAACRGTDVNLWVPGPTGRPSKKLAALYQLCTTCPVAAECLYDAEADPTNNQGIRAGMTARQRRKARAA